MTHHTHRRRRPTPSNRPKPAAGLLLRYTDQDGDWYLLGKRHRRLGGTWANIGGSLKAAEDPLGGAMREFREELSVNAAGLAGATIAEAIQCGTELVPYTMFVLDVATWFDDAELSWEHDELYWWHADDVGTLPLHPGFARAWTTLDPPRPARTATPPRLRTSSRPADR